MRCKMANDGSGAQAESGIERLSASLNESESETSSMSEDDANQGTSSRQSKQMAIPKM